MRRTYVILSSNRQAFRALQPEKKVLDFLDKIGLGRPVEKGTRKLVSIKRRQLGLSKHHGTKTPSSFPLSDEESPHPFNRGPQSVTRIIQIDKFEDLPDYGPVPEVAVIGRSNVGKSTLLNALMGFTSHVQKATVSSKPGETKKLQFFCIGSYNNKKSGPKVAVVDMPGYGFSYMSEELASRVSNLTSDYICQRGSVLKRVLLILDARHGFKKTDTEYLNELAALAKETSHRKINWKLQVVLTKCDLLSRHDVARRVMSVREHMTEHLHGAALSNLPIVTVSGHERRGIVQLQREIASLVPAAPIPPVEKSYEAPKTTTHPKDSSSSEELKDSKNVGKQPRVSNNKLKNKKVGTSRMAKSSNDVDGSETADSKKKNSSVHSDGPKIAVGLIKKSKVSKPSMEEYDAAMAPISKEGVSTLTMSDRLDEILGHYLDREKNKVGNDPPSSASRTGKSVAASENSEDNQDDSKHRGGSRADYYQRVKMLRSNKKASDESGSSKEKIFKKTRSEEELQRKQEKKDLYRSRYAKEKK